MTGQDDGARAALLASADASRTPSVAPWASFTQAVESRRSARRDLRRAASAVHREEQATNAAHSTAARWEDCWDCASTVLRDARAALGMPRYPTASRPDMSLDASFDVQCQGCGTVRNGMWLDKPHACWRNEDGTYEEGGTFQ